MTKKIIIYCLAICFFYNCESVETNDTIIKLQFYNTNINQVSIEQSTIGDYSFSFRKKVNKADKTPFLLIDTLSLPSSGYYNLFFNKNNIPLYLRKGTKTDIIINPLAFNEVSFSGDSVEENNYLIKKRKLKNTTNGKNIRRLKEKQFLDALADYKTTLLKFLDDENVAAIFKEQEIKEINYEIAMEQLIYPEGHTRLTGQVLDLSLNYYDNLKSINFTDTLYYSNSPTGNYPILVKEYYNKIAKDKRKTYGNNQTLAFIREVDKDFPDGSIKEDLFKFRLRYGLKNSLNLDNIYSTVINTITDQAYIEHLTDQYQAIKNLEKGKYAPDFQLENLNKEIIGLSSLKGHHVYIDVWATWCRPCIEEFPALNDIIAKHKNIKFVSISIDKKSNYKKWQDMTEAYDLKHTQLIAYDNSDFRKNYAIGSIPRFIIIDKEGKIVTVDAPSPSSENLSVLLDNLK